MGNVAVVRHLGVRRIVCSTARRAYQTAQVYRALLGLPIYCTQHFRELDHGKWEGRKLTELVLDEESGYAKWLSDPGSIAIPGGSETVQAAQQRAAQALRNVALSFCDESVLVIGHKHINALLMCALLKEPLTRFRSHIVEDTLPHLIVADTIEALCEGETMLSGVRNWSIPGNRCTNVKGADRSVEKSCLSSWWPSGIQPMQLKGEPEDDQDNSDRRR